MTIISRTNAFGFDKFDELTVSLFYWSYLTLILFACTEWLHKVKFKVNLQINIQEHEKDFMYMYSKNHHSQYLD